MGGLSIGTYFGFRLRVHWSWLVIFALFTWNLTVGFEHLRPEWGRAFSVALAAGAALALFLSVLLHELAHSAVARARGMPVRDITLFLFGGASNIEREPPDPKSEFLFTVVGPIVSFLIGIATLAVVFAWAGEVDWTSVEAIEQLNPGQLVLLWLGQINIILAIFNLVPGFPLDGGRILRSAVWAATGNLRTATRWAARTGQLVAFLLIATGIAMALGYDVPVLGSGVAGGVWLVIIGIFLNGAAVANYQQVVLGDVLGQVRVRDIMRRQFPDIDADATVDELVHERIMGSDARAFPVRGDAGGGLAGLVCLQDVRSVPRDRWAGTPVRDVMTPREQLTTVSADATADDALRELAGRDVDQLPVLEDDGRLQGMVHRSDILRWIELERDERRG